VLDSNVRFPAEVAEVNIVVAGAGASAEARTDLTRLAEGRYGQSGHRLGGDDVWAHCVADADGVVLGHATTEDEAVSVVLLGCLNGPCPGFEGGSPMDSPDRAASYLLKRYQSQGTSFLDGIVGQFAVLVLDGQKKELLLGSDPTGLRTLFYRLRGSELLVSSNVSTLAAARPESGLEQELQDFFLCYGFMPWRKTVYDDVTYLQPGSLVRFAQGKLETLEVAHPNPWADQFEGFSFDGASESRAVDALHDAFMLASEQQLAGDKKAAVLLGGVDSALVAAVLHRLGKEVETFSFYYEPQSFNQPHTDTLSKYLGIKHNWVPITPEVIAAGIADYSAKFNFPTNWLNYVVQTEYLCQVMKKGGFKYIYSGDGCDGTFLGYPRVHVVAKILDRMGHLNPRVANAAARALDFGTLEYALGRPYGLALQFVSSLARDLPERGYSTFRVMDENSLCRLKGGSSSAVRASNESILQRAAAPHQGLSMDRLAYAGKNALSPNRSKMAGSSDSTGVVINTPYLHSGMKAFALSIPDHLLRPEGDKADYNGKYLLFKMCEDKKLLPKEINYQKKISAVDAPVDDWYIGGLAPQIRRALEGLPFVPNPEYLDYLLREKWAEQLYKQHIASDALTSHALALLTAYSRFTNPSEIRALSGS
jgi:asparagine synthetase B (glutamine-hydrolysing)